ncbi:MAG: sulfotransferase [Synechococcus sp.]
MQFLIIGGTEKAGTTSLFNYLSQHPQLLGSVKKETDYFRQQGSLSLEDYLKEFPVHSGDRILLEASPGYLSRAEQVAGQLAEVLKNESVKLIFILRDPAERLVSNFRFHKTKGNLPDDLSIQDFLDANITFTKTGEMTLPAVKGDWFYQSFEQGFYDRLLANFYDVMPEGSIAIYDFEDFKTAPSQVVQDICKQIGVDASFYDDFDFFVFNRTIKPKSRWLHLIGDKVNSLLEPFFNRFPQVKQTVKNIYCAINEQNSSDDGEKQAEVEAAKRSFKQYVSVDYKNKFVQLGR